MNLAEFQTRLQLLIERPTPLRPFVCDGSPLDCRIFIVGVNPATELSGDWWDFWDSARGFDRARWLAHYRAERARKPLKPGRTRRSEISPTRRAIEWIVQATAPIKCLETNIHSIASASAAELSHEHRITQAFDFLVESIRPDIILAHGKDAEDHLRARAGFTEVGDLERLASDGPSLHVVPHLSRGWSQEAARNLGKQLRAALENRRRQV